MSMRALKLNFRTTLCFGVVCLLLLIQGAMTLIKVDKVYSSTVEIESNWLPSIRLAGEIDSAFYKLRLDLRRYAMDIGRQDPASLEKLKATRTEALDLAERYGPLVSSPEERAKYNDALTGIKNYSQKMDEFLVQASTLSAEQMSTYLRDVNGPIAVAVQRSISELIALNEQGSKAAVQVASSEYDAARLFTWILMGASLLITVVVASLFTRSIITPVRELLVSTGKIADGDLRVAIAINGNDELTALQRSTASMQMNLKSTLQHISEASGQLAAAAEEMSAMGPSPRPRIKVPWSGKRSAVSNWISVFSMSCCVMPNLPFRMSIKILRLRPCHIKRLPSQGQVRAGPRGEKVGDRLIVIPFESP